MAQLTRRLIADTVTGKTAARLDQPEKTGAPGF